MGSKKWSNIELKEFLKRTTSIIKVTGRTIIFRKEAILNAQGNPVPLKEFMVRSGLLKFRVNYDHNIFKKSPSEKRILKAAKKDYKENMKALFNGDKNWAKKARTLQIHNVPDDSKVIAELQKQLA